jgi:plasmid stabilization system protein ParE
MRIRYLEDAHREIREGAEYYRKAASPAIAQAFRRAVRDAVRLIRAQPLAWQKTDIFGRRYVMSRFPYSVIYEIDGDDLVVVAIACQHREPHYWANRSVGL